METAKGKVFKYGDNVDTDVIIPARYLNVSSGEELAKYCMIDIDADFVNNVKEGDIIVATKNFGCGSSREHAPLTTRISRLSPMISGLMGLASLKALWMMAGRRFAYSPRLLRSFSKAPASGRRFAGR